MPNIRDRRIRLVRLCAIAFAGCYVAVSCHIANAYTPQMLRWEVRATVTDIVDPLGLFPDVRLGDPVRGMLKYDTSLYANPLYSGRIPEDLTFTNEKWLDTVRMVIENPRAGTEMQFTTEVGFYNDVEVFNDYPDAEHGDFDGLYAYQSVAAPDGFMGDSPVVAVFITGPTSALPTYPPHLPFTAYHPPAELDLDDWPIAAMEFWDGDFQDPTATNIEAEIYSITAVLTPQIPGDYDFDGDVDAADYYGWKYEFGDDILHYTDGNDNGITDAADYVVWRANLGRTSDSASTSNGRVPEPGMPTLLVLAAALGGRLRCRIAKRAHQLVDA
jgi:hypothetical protein